MLLDLGKTHYTIQQDGVQDGLAFNRCCITQFIECPYQFLIGARKGKELEATTATADELRLNTILKLPLPFRVTPP